MQTPRRHVLRTAAATVGAAGTIATPGCQTLTEPTQLLIVENRTDTDHSVTITIRRARDDDATTTDANATTTAGTSSRFVVDFQYDVPGGSRREAPNVIPNEGTYDVEATVTDVGTARTTYTDDETVRVTITDDGVTAESSASE
jgi:hypothetical protein